MKRLVDYYNRKELLAFLDSVEKRREKHQQKLWNQNNNLPMRHKHSKTREVRTFDKYKLQ